MSKCNLTRYVTQFETVYKTHVNTNCVLQSPFLTVTVMNTSSKTIFITFVCYLHIFVYAVPIDNGLTGKIYKGEIIRKNRNNIHVQTGDPEIKCGQDSMTVVFQTKREFEGNLYINGRFNDNGCKVSGNNKKQIQIQVSYSGSCGIRRKRQVCRIVSFLCFSVLILL